MLSLQALTDKIQAQYIGDDMPLPNVSIDSRTVQAGDVFVAIKGPSFDGHDFVSKAIAQGAAAVMVDHDMSVNVPQIVVEDTTLGLGQLAHAHRQQFDLPLIGLTGSCGKTTTKEMLAMILAEAGNTLATDGNKNNYWGLPLMLLRLRPEHEFAVIEMGTNAPGEIDYLAKITSPTVSLITNIHEQHVAGLESAQGIANEKSAIYTHTQMGGTMVLNEDEPFSKQWEKKNTTCKLLTCSRDQQSDVYATDIKYDAWGTNFTLHTPSEEGPVTIPLLGAYIVDNALAAATCAIAVGAKLEHIQQGLKKAKAYKGRLALHQLSSGAKLIDDTYNSSPISIYHAMQVLQQFAGQRILVLTNITELGERAEHYHHQVGHWLTQHQFDHVYLFGDKKHLAWVREHYPAAKWYESKTTLVETLKGHANEKDTTVLVKGARSNKMETVVHALIEEEAYVD